MLYLLVQKILLSTTLSSTIIIPDTKIYIQDLYPERIKQSLRAVLPHIKENNIILLKEVDQFYLPPEL